MIPADPSLREAGMRVDEWAIVRFDGREQTITMRLESSAAFDRAALIVPLPAEADFSLGDDAVFDEIAERTKPRVETETRYTFFEGSDDDEGGSAEGGAAGTAGAGVEVVGSENLGPLRVVTLRGDDAGVVATWLSDHGFEPPESMEDAAQPYLDRGWVLSAVRLRGAAGREVRSLQPLVMRLDVREPVYPLMWTEATPPGIQARVDVVAPWPVAVHGYATRDVRDPGDRTSEGRLFAGPLPGGRYLTTYRFVSHEPPARTDVNLPNRPDAEFTRAPERGDFRQVRVVHEEVDVGVPVVAGIVAVGAALALFRRRRRRARP